MKNKKGFTLLEILTVLGLIGIIFLIAIPAISFVSNSIRKRQLEAKKEVLLSAAEVYAKNNSSEFANFSVDSYIIILPVRTLLYYGYTNPDADDSVGACDETIGCVINPVHNTSMNDELITIKKIKNVIQSNWGDEEHYEGLSVKFDLNGADSIIYPSGSTNNCLAPSGGSCTIIAPTIIRQNFTVLGWGRQASARAASLEQGGQLTINDENNDSTYYAITKKDVTISFNANEGTLASASDSTKTCSYYNTSSGCSVITPNATKDGYQLSSWNTNLYGTGTTVTNSSLLSSNTIAYAIWTPKTYTLVRRTESYTNWDEFKDYGEGYVYGSNYTGETNCPWCATFELNTYGCDGGFTFPSGIFKDGQRYIITFKVQKYENNLYKISGNIGSSSTQHEFKIDGVNSTLSYNDSSTAGRNVANDENVHSVYLDFTYKGSSGKVYFIPNRGQDEWVYLHLIDIDIYQVFESTSKTYGTEYISDNLATKTFGTRKAVDWYNTSILDNDAILLSTSNIFDKNTAWFEDINTSGTKAYIFGEVVSNSSSGGSCSTYLVVNNINALCGSGHNPKSVTWCACDETTTKNCISPSISCASAAQKICANRSGLVSYNSGCYNTTHK